MRVTAKSLESKCIDGSGVEMLCIAYVGYHLEMNVRGKILY